MLGSDNSVACWFVMNIYSAPIARSSISPASGLRSGGVFETRSSQFFQPDCITKMWELPDIDRFNDKFRDLSRSSVGDCAPAIGLSGLRRRCCFPLFWRDVCADWTTASLGSC